MNKTYNFRTLPDYIGPGLKVVLIGINPGQYSVEHGHYFARPQSRFWRALSASKLSEPVRRALGVAALIPEHDKLLPSFGIGLTDIVKRPTRNASELTLADFEESVPQLIDKLLRHRPNVACFHGVTGYAHFGRLPFQREDRIILGAQQEQLGSTRFFVVPNPSPANAHFTPTEQAEWYDRLADFVAAVARTRKLPGIVKGLA